MKKFRIPNIPPTTNKSIRFPNDVIDEIKRFLHEAGKYIIWRMGIPYREKGINIISIAIDAPQDVISSLSGKIGRLSGVSAKTAYSNVITKAEDRK